MALFFLSLLMFSCGGKTVAQAWCESRTIAALKALSGTTATTSWCATLDAHLVFKKEATKGCLAGAYYLEDSTSSVFVCDPSIKSAQADSGVVTCPTSITAYKQDTTLNVGVKAEGLYYPAKATCKQLLCKCQNGIELDRIEVNP